MHSLQALVSPATTSLRHSFMQNHSRLTPDAMLQVGSKNAAFFMGKCIKIATRSDGSSFVHELGIAAADLEERYKAHEASLAHLSIQRSHHTMQDQ